jgi:hypothetical protein
VYVELPPTFSSASDLNMYLHGLLLSTDVAGLFAKQSIVFGKRSHMLSSINGVPAITEYAYAATRYYL